MLNIYTDEELHAALDMIEDFVINDPLITPSDIINDISKEILSRIGKI